MVAILNTNSTLSSCLLYMHMHTWIHYTCGMFSYTDSETPMAKEPTPPSSTSTSQVKEQSSSSSLPLHMLTPVSGPPTITLENEPSTTVASTCKTTDTPSLLIKNEFLTRAWSLNSLPLIAITSTLPSPSVRVTKIEQQRSYSGASGGTTLLQLLPDTTSNTTSTNSLSSLASVMQKSPQVNIYMIISF